MFTITPFSISTTQLDGFLDEIDGFDDEMTAILTSCEDLIIYFCMNCR